MVPAIRIRAVNAAPVCGDADCVLYWMIAARRTGWNFGLQRAIEHATALGKPLVVLEPLRCDHPWAAARFHQFVIDGMRDQARAFHDVATGGAASDIPAIARRKPPIMYKQGLLCATAGLSSASRVWAVPRHGRPITTRPLPGENPACT